MATTCVARAESSAYLAAGQDALAGDDAYAAARAFQQAIYLDPTLYPAYIGLARAFFAGGFIDNAIQHFARAARFGSVGADDQSLWAQAVHMRDARTAELKRARELLGMPVLRFLGAGWEGANYTVREPDGARVVVKAFHPAFVQLINYDGPGGVYREPVPSARRDFLRLAAGPDERDHALFRFRPIEVDGRIVAVKYRYQYLLPVGARCLRSHSMRLAVLAAFFRSQAYLLRRFALCLSDAWAMRQFMVNVHGQPYYVDYGTSIIPIDDFRCREDHWELLAAIELLCSVFEPEREAQLSGSRVGQAVRCAAALGAAARRLPCVRTMLRHLEAGKWDVFLDADFYRHLGDGLPTAAGVLPRIAGGASVLRHKVSGRLRSEA